MLGLDNPIHLAFILVLLLLIFGAKRLPEMGRSLGAGLRGFKDSISGEVTTLSEQSPAPAQSPIRTSTVPVAHHDDSPEQTSPRIAA